MGRAYIEQVILQDFIKAVQSVEDRELRHVLKRLCDLYALSTMEQNIGSFRNIEIIKSNKAKAIRMLVGDLCKEIRHHAVSLVDSFDIPDFLIDAPIGLSNIWDNNYVNNILEYVQGTRKSLIPSEKSPVSPDSELEERKISKY